MIFVMVIIVAIVVMITRIMSIIIVPVHDSPSVAGLATMRFWFSRCCSAGCSSSRP